MDKRLAGYYEQHHVDRFIPEHDLGILTLRHIPRGNPIIDQDRPVTDLLFLVEGRARVFTSAANGRQLLLCFYEPLQVLGDLEIMEGSSAATTNVEAVTPCWCLAAPREYVTRRLASDNEFVRGLSAVLARKLDRVIRNSALNLLHPVEERLASFIAASAVATPGGPVFRANITHVAEQLGTSFRHVHRLLSALCAEGLLEKTAEGYVVVRPVDLNARGGGAYVLPG